jgi:hypothetical protein
MITTPDAGAIRAYLFYGESGWPTLFSSLLKPLIDHLQHQRRISGFALFLRKSRGDHIRMSLQPRKSDDAYRNMLKKDLKKIIDAFFSFHPSPMTPPPSPCGYFFMDFPPDSLYFDLPDRHPRLWEHGLPVDIRPLAQEISRILLAVLATEDADDTEQTDIALYLELALLKAMEPYLPKGLRSSPDSADSRMIERALPGSRHILSEMKKEIWAPEDDRLSWLNNWMKLCVQVFAKTSGIGAIGYADLLSAALFRHFNIPGPLAMALHNELKNDLRS